MKRRRQRRIKRQADLAAARGHEHQQGPQADGLHTVISSKCNKKTCTDIANPMITHDLNRIIISIALIYYMERDRSSVGLNDMEAPRQSSSRGLVPCFWSTNRKKTRFCGPLKSTGPIGNCLLRLMSNPALDRSATTSVPSSSISDNPECTSTSNIFPEASTSEVRPFIPTDSEENKGDDSEKGDNEEVQSNNESNRNRESEEDKDRPETFIDLDVEMLYNI
ncbi:hypothetical protein NPIL_566531 [Nephila pilipes]|uniref:Uncharacterized protein n=1 Tax=Nephila pilipes TaxID=299642 RepID=A0A8X6TCV1_NEPPI|nr:hypothetical protein NPIL_566531 [Nephila pilipes]